MCRTKTPQFVLSTNADKNQIENTTLIDLMFAAVGVLYFRYSSLYNTPSRVLCAPSRPPPLLPGLPSHTNVTYTLSPAVCFNRLVIVLQSDTCAASPAARDVQKYVYTTPCTARVVRRTHPAPSPDRATPASTPRMLGGLPGPVTSTDGRGRRPPDWHRSAGYRR